MYHILLWVNDAIIQHKFIHFSFLVILSLNEFFRSTAQPCLASVSNDISYCTTILRFFWLKRINYSTHDLAILLMVWWQVKSVNWWNITTIYVIYSSYNRELCMQLIYYCVFTKCLRNNDNNTNIQLFYSIQYQDNVMRSVSDWYQIVTWVLSYLYSWVSLDCWLDWCNKIGIYVCSWCNLTEVVLLKVFTAASSKCSFSA